jgi:hypothetical protein
MKHIRIFWRLAVPMLAITTLGQGTKGAATATAPQAQQPATIASAVDYEISGVEKQIVDVAEAMPEDKYNFSPDGLKIPGSDYKGARTFAMQVKHVAASNYAIWWRLQARISRTTSRAGTVLKT